MNKDLHEELICPKYITILIPLVDFTLENGVTEFIVKSHKDLKIDIKEIIKDKKKIIGEPVKLNSIIIMDGRIVHRGLGNKTLENRPTIWLTFYLP
jgi:ectoine hydroxylase-related dioxygenase (phytanoyl-CoA dioxygenase family)